MFVIPRISHIEIRYIEFLFHTFYCNFGLDGVSFVISRTSLNRGSLNRGSSVVQNELDGKLSPRGMSFQTGGL